MTWRIFLLAQVCYMAGLVIGKIPGSQWYLGGAVGIVAFVGAGAISAWSKHKQEEAA